VTLRVLTLVLVIGIAGSLAPAQLADVSAEQTTVCDIVNHPSRFIGKTVEVRAQIWPDSRNPKFFWMNEASPQFDKVCRFLQASFKVGSDLYGQTAFGTFRGRIVKKIYHQESTLLSPIQKDRLVIFLVDQQSDIYMRRDYLNGPIPKLQLYDPQSASIIRPED
jgi:hypothetical protein